MIRIITDSTSDLTLEMAASLGIDIISLPVYFGAEKFRDGIDLSRSQFYHKLSAAKELPKTSQINPNEFAAIFSQYLEQGDEVFGVFLSSELSGTFQSAMIAKAELNSDKIQVLDSRSVTFALGLLVIEAVKLRDQGSSLSELTAAMAELTPKLRLWAVVDTLKYLKMGGRISATSAAIGGVIGITPLISVTGGKVEAIGKTRGRKNGLKRLAELIKQHPPDISYTVAFGHSDAEAALKEAIDALAPLTGVTEYLVGNIGAVVGTHVGPNAVGVAYIEK